MESQFQPILISTTSFDILACRPRPLLFTFPNAAVSLPVFSTSHPSYGRPFSSRPTVAIHRGDPSGPVIGCGYSPVFSSSWSVSFHGLGGEGKISSEFLSRDYTVELPDAIPPSGDGGPVDGTEKRPMRLTWKHTRQRRRGMKCVDAAGTVVAWFTPDRWGVFHDREKTGMLEVRCGLRAEWFEAVVISWVVTAERIRRERRRRAANS